MAVRAVAVTPDGRARGLGLGRSHAQGLGPGAGRLVATLEGHGDRVTAVAVTPDGERAVSGSTIGRSRSGTWSRAGSATLEGHGDGVWAVAVTPDGQARSLGLGRWHAQGLGPGAGRAASDPGGPWRCGLGGGGDAGRAARGLGLVTMGRSRSGICRHLMSPSVLRRPPGTPTPRSCWSANPASARRVSPCDLRGRLARDLLDPRHERLASSSYPRARSAKMRTSSARSGFGTSPASRTTA